MKTNESNFQVAFESDYNKIMKDFRNSDFFNMHTPQWTQPNDYIVKFSLFDENRDSITSTDTLITP